MILDEYDERGSLRELAQEAAPLISIAALKGGSLFYKQWLDKAKALGVKIDESNSDD